LTFAQRAVKRHIVEFFDPRMVGEVAAPARSQERVPGYTTFLVEPPGGNASPYVYVTAGCWDQVHADGDGHGSEFVLITRDHTPANVLRLAMTAFYHCAPDASQRLGVGHTVPCGEPWVPGAAADHLLVSVPYPFGPSFEVCAWQGGHARLLWLLPITKAERDYKAANGLEALEAKFESASIDYTDPNRPSFV
jgi:hypothetical protein